MDLIRRSDAIDALSEAIEDCFVLHDAIKAIKSVPSVQQEIVLCKDCIRRNSHRCPFNRDYHAEGINIALDYTKDDGFCHWGEREEDE